MMIKMIKLIERLMILKQKKAAQTPVGPVNSKLVKTLGVV